MAIASLAIAFVVADGDSRSPDAIVEIAAGRVVFREQFCGFFDPGFALPFFFYKKLIDGNDSLAGNHALDGNAIDLLVAQNKLAHAKVFFGLGGKFAMAALRGKDGQVVALTDDKPFSQTGARADDGNGGLGFVFTGL